MSDRRSEDKEEELVEIRSLDLNCVKVVCPAGRGAKGVVFRIRLPDSEEDLALKVVLKSKSSSEKNRMWFERDVLSNLRHPLLPKLHGVLETENVVGYAIDYCPGGDLNSVRRQQSEKMFSDDIIRFYAAELVLALEYLHKSGIVYRDLKPENVLIQQNGHLMVVDFDLAKQLGRRSNSFVGTEDYVAPEIVAGKGHDYGVDWWSLGIVMYEMLYGTTPFRGSSRKETFSRIVTKKPDLMGETTSLRDLIRRLLEKEAEKRIQLEEIKGHEFFRGVDWEMIWRIQRPPFIPFNQQVKEEEDIDGIDLERIVYGIFQSKKEGLSGNHSPHLQNNNKPVWLHGLEHPSESHNFMVF